MIARRLSRPCAGLSRRSLTGYLAVAGGLIGDRSALAIRAESHAVTIRRDIASLALTPRRLASLEAAIGEMQRRSLVDPDDPGGWRAHAQNHARVCSAVSNTDPDQVHGGWWFLPWHRAFLAVTEWKLRAISGDPHLTLPYWNWSSDRAIPAPFARPGSPLAQAIRHTPNRALRAAEVDWLPHDPDNSRLGVAGLGATFFEAASPAEIPLSFGGIAKPNPAGWHGRSRLETIPHTAIHNYAGGEAADGSLGDMTELATAALDPLFYAHHANLDRLWEIWRSDARRKVTEPAAAFASKSFVLSWLDGSPIAVAAADTLDTGRLGYVYDSLLALRGKRPPREDNSGAGRSRADRSGRALAVETLICSRGSPAVRSTLKIGGVQPTDRPITVEVVVAAANDPATAIVVGAFSMGRMHGPAVFPDTEPRFDITAALERLDTRAIDVSVVPLTLGPGSPPSFRYTRMEIVREG